ncbi:MULTISPECIES: carbohydrate ABC transporter permease [Streptomyces]|uniref:Sugar ABC transporter permease n=1 Tax=Streptomyces drozdowiczii TaxID=202862 RepID=A0ABY6PN12_9ACTN|nr:MULTISPECIES: sugar ABC transporter permease [Streptomyces]MCX0247111.1 sugar ABC transporter permease [Streptomyces drozdowiczii]OKJ74978.1 ABC transporter permease [Streptomyces sp. CB02460]UZK53456.1 sugar ABC transporter permease [Streptomyces drozdowiczii]
MALQARIRPGTGRSGRRAGRLRPERHLLPYLFIAPFFVVFGIFGLYPLLQTFWVSLHDWDRLAGPGQWTGLDNFTRLLGDSDFYTATYNTFSIFVLSTAPQLVAAVALAWLLDRKLRASSVWRALVLVPQYVSVVAVALVFSQLFGRDFGIVNWALEGLGIISSPVDWTADTWSSHLAISFMVMWRWTGYNALIYLAAMQAVPRELYESAQIDGAGRLRTFLKVTLPAIRPTVVFTVVISTIGGLQLFAEPFLFDQQGNAEGGAEHQFQTLTLMLYKYGFINNDAGYASAISWVLFLVIAVVAAINFLLVRRSDRG